MTAPTRAARMEALLRLALNPAVLVVRDDSARHAGHAGADPRGETHFALQIVSKNFSDLTRVARSRAVHEALRSEFEKGLHALSLELRSPDEAASINREYRID